MMASVEGHGWAGWHTPLSRNLYEIGALGRIGSRQMIHIERSSRGLGMNKFQLTIRALAALPICLLFACHAKADPEHVVAAKADPPYFEPIKNDPTGFPNPSQSALLSEIVAYLKSRALAYGLSPDRTNQMLWGFHFFVPVKFVPANCHLNIVQKNPLTGWAVDPNSQEEKLKSFAKMSMLAADVLSRFKSFSTPDSHGENMHSLEMKMCKFAKERREGDPYICGDDYLITASKYGLQDPNVYPSVNDFIGNGKYDLRSQIESFYRYRQILSEKNTIEIRYTYEDRVFFEQVKPYICKFHVK